MKHNFKIFLAPFLGFVSFFSLWYSGSDILVCKMSAVAVWMAVWWLTEAVHLAVTSLLPVVLLPLLGIADSKTISTQYMDPIIFLFIGGFIIAFAIEKWNLHQRFALKILMIVGTSPSRIVLGVMLSAYFISMWISNTATVMMLISAVMALIYEIEKLSPHQEKNKKLFAAILIGLAYSATIGGMATLVGTPTNMIFLREYNERFSAFGQISFAKWMMIGLPISLALLLFTFLMLKIFFLRKVKEITISKEFISNSYRDLGVMSFEEKVVATIFSLTAILWFTRSDIDFGLFYMKGWSNLFENKEFITDSVVAMFMALLLFFIPAKKEGHSKIMTWSDTLKLPFDIILLFGGGFALAKGFELSGLSTWIASRLSGITDLNYYVFILVLCIIVTIISEFASNVSCIQLMIPVLVSIQVQMDIHPLLLLIPATLASSLGFMLPVATAANTIVFGTKRIKSSDMIRAGVWIDIAGIIFITFASAIISQLI